MQSLSEAAKKGWFLPLLLLLTLAVSQAEAFWRMPCGAESLLARVDPVGMPPGNTPSKHVHTFVGSSGVGLNSTYDSLQLSDCTTCKVKKDKSAYWAPQLYYQFDNQTFTAVDHGGMLIYYLQRMGKGDTRVRAFPPGLKMLTGDAGVRSYTGTNASKAISWACLDKYPTPQTPGLNNTNCANGLRAQIFFPSCWDGKNLDSEDHQSHMAYPSNIDSGDCPASHPVRLVSIFYEILYNVKAINDLGKPGRFVLSNGDTTGYSLHGDFQNGWDEAYLQKALDVCTADSGVIEDCSVFQGGMNTGAEMSQCSAKNPFPEENTRHPGTKLPGCNPITSGPERAPSVTCAADGSVVATSGNSTTTNSTSTNSTVSTGTTGAVTTLPSTTVAAGTGSAASTSVATGSATGAGSAHVTKTIKRCRATPSPMA